MASIDEIVVSNASTATATPTQVDVYKRQMLYWMQTEAPRHDGGYGYAGLRLRPDIVGSRDGLAKHIYIRESRRIKAEFTVQEQHVGVEARGQQQGAESFFDSVGIGSYRIDLHPSTCLLYTSRCV